MEEISRKADFTGPTSEYIGPLANSGEIRQSSKHVVGLDIMRFFAAALVASLHLWASQSHGGTALMRFVAQRYSFDELSFDGPTLPPVAFLGSVGVQFFFMISGYVIVFSAAKSQSVVRFLYNRALRLVPALWLCTLFSALLLLATGFLTVPQAIIQTAGSILLLPFGAKIDGVVWTLNLEVVFYLYVATLIWLQRLNWIDWLALGLATVSLCYWGIYFGFDCSYSVSSSNAACGLYSGKLLYKISSLLLIQHGGFFAVGICFWLLATKGYRPLTLLALVIAFIACVAQLKWTSGYYYAEYGLNGAPTSPFLLIALWMTWTATMAFLIAFNDKVHALTSSAGAFLRLLGVATYPLYLIHGILGSILIVTMMNLGFGGFPSFMMAVVICSMISMWIATVPEQMLRKTINAIVRRSDR